MSYNHTWNILGYVLNGFVFSILGFLVPEVIVKIIKTEPHNLLFLVVITVLVALAVYLFRFVWVYVLYPFISLVIAQVLLPLVTPNKPKVNGNMTFKEARVYILEHVIDYLNQKSTFETSYRYGNVIKEYHDKLTFLS